MAKKKSKKFSFTKKQKSTRSSMMDAIMDNTLKNRGDSAASMDADLYKNLQKGIELPPLCLQSLFKTSAFPLEKMIQIHGGYQTCKSAFALKLAQWFVQSNGFVWYIDTEHKMPIDIATDFISNFGNSNHVAAIQPQPANMEQLDEGELEDHEYGTIKDVQTIMDEAFESMRALNTEVNKHNKQVDNGESSEERWDNVPGLIVLDSLAATVPSKDSEKFADGDYSQTMATAAKEWTKYLSHASSNLANIWTSFVFINHDRDNISPYGGGKTQPGGTNKDYLKSYDLQFKKSYSGDSYKRETKSHTIEGQQSIEVKIKKNATGPAKTTLDPLNFHWEGRNFEWQFDRCTINMIKSTNSVQEIGPIEKKDVKKYNKKFKIPSLGIDTYKEPSVVMDELRSNTEFMEALYGIWGIKHMDPNKNKIICIEETEYDKDIAKDQEDEDE